MLRLISSLALLLTLAATVHAADIDKGLKSAVDEVVACAEEQQVKSIVLVVRFDPTGIVEDSREATLTELRDNLQSLLGTELLVTVVKDTGRATRPFTSDDFSKFEGLDGQDAVLCVDYKRTDRTGTARLTLVNSEEVLFTRLTALGTPDAASVSKLTTQTKPPRKTSRTKKNNGKSSTAATTGSSGSGGGSSSTQGSAVGGAMAMQYALAQAQSATGDDPNKEPVYNKTILNFAVSKLGQIVGDGKSKSLVIAALAEADARPLIEKNLDWGTPVANHEILPGDIVQIDLGGLHPSERGGVVQGVHFFTANTWLCGQPAKVTAIIYTWDYKKYKGTIIAQGDYRDWDTDKPGEGYPGAQRFGIMTAEVHTTGVNAMRARNGEFKVYRARRKTQSTDPAAKVTAATAN